MAEEFLKMVGQLIFEADGSSRIPSFLLTWV
jgi:hypothetical protein